MKSDFIITTCVCHCILFMNFPYRITKGLRSYHIHFNQKFLEKNLSAFPSPHHKSTILAHFFSLRFCFMTFKCESKEGTYGACLNPVIIGHKTRKIAKTVNQSTINNKRIATIIIKTYIMTYVRVPMKNKSDFFDF